jgi:preprotein translocase subunit SecA
MHKIDEALYFVIEENNQVELTDNGIKYLSGDTDADFSFYQTLELKLPISKKKIRIGERKKRSFIQDFSIKASVFIH